MSNRTRLIQLLLCVSALLSCFSLIVQVNMLEAKSVYDNAPMNDIPEPEINVQGNGLNIVNGDTVPSLADHSGFGKVDVGTGTVTRTVIIQNLGTTDLVLPGATPVTLSGLSAGDFSVVAQPASPVPPASSTSFQVKFVPSTVGVRGARITIANNDPDENPYMYHIQGTGISAPEINVTGAGITILNGDTTPRLADGTEFKDVNFQLSTERIFYIQNLGDKDLQLTGNPMVRLQGPHADKFWVLRPPVGRPITPGETDNFVIRYQSSSPGQAHATVVISSNDWDENPYTFAIQGPNRAPKINVTGNGIHIINGDTVPSLADHTGFGPVSVTEGEKVRRFTIQNRGNYPLSFTGNPQVILTGPASIDFSVHGSIPAIFPGDSDYLTVSFDPRSFGVRGAIISIPNSDPTNDPYVFYIQGRGIEAPEINLTGNDVNITNGDMTPRPADFTDFGSVLVSGGQLTRAFEIHNSGDTTLNLTRTPRVQLEGIEAGAFAVIVQPAGAILPGEKSSFLIRFDPSAFGSFKATINIYNDDPDENPFRFAVQGKGGQASEMSVRGNDLVINDGKTVPLLVDHTGFGLVLVNGGTVTRTYTIESLGDIPLNLTGSPRVRIVGSHAADFSVIAQPASSVNPGGTTTFQVRFNPSAIGIRGAMVTISNNDPDENPYNFNIQGTGVTLLPGANSLSEVPSDIQSIPLRQPSESRKL